IISGLQFVFDRSNQLRKTEVSRDGPRVQRWARATDERGYVSVRKPRSRRRRAGSISRTPAQEVGPEDRGREVGGAGSAITGYRRARGTAREHRTPARGRHQGGAARESA